MYRLSSLDTGKGGEKSVPAMNSPIKHDFKR